MADFPIASCVRSRAGRRVIETWAHFLQSRLVTNSTMTGQSSAGPNSVPTIAARMDGFAHFENFA
jgi:hypothetical protein